MSLRHAHNENPVRSDNVRPLFSREIFASLYHPSPWLTICKKPAYFKTEAIRLDGFCFLLLLSLAAHLLSRPGNKILQFTGRNPPIFTVVLV